MTSHNQLRACLRSRRFSTRLTVQVARQTLCVRISPRRGFTRGLDGFKRSGRTVDRFQQPQASGWPLIVVSATLPQRARHVMTRSGSGTGSDVAASGILAAISRHQVISH